ncbi:MAG: hypothetical protein HRS57_02655, partial [Mycoplasmataceae bacterium]|nr:hypothetical protein [Mycoplasmataceae bacterium]
ELINMEFKIGDEVRILHNNHIGKITFIEAGNSITVYTDNQLSFVCSQEELTLELNLAEPEYYKCTGDDAITFSFNNQIEPCGATVVKYLARKGKKIHPGKTALESERIDIEKSISYLNRRLKQIDKKG